MPRNRVYAIGKDHHLWKGGPRQVDCAQCGKHFETRQPNQRFCSMDCSHKGQRYNYGVSHHNYRPEARRKNRCGSHHKWVNAVISRDKATCQHCGTINVELHAHHLKSYKDFPELRFEVSNGITLCFKCHWAVHTAINAKVVNSVDPLTDKAEGNTEPSFERNLVEGVTTRGRAFRRWVGECFWCHKTISKRWSDTKGRKTFFCDKHCMGKYHSAHRKWRPWKNPTNGDKSSTNAAPERDDIV